VHTGPRVAHGFQVPYIYDYITKLRGQQAEVIQYYENANIRDIGKGEAGHTKYNWLKLGGGQTYDRSRDLAAFVT
jgi:hypothetical protein